MDELLRNGLAELDGQQGVGNDGEVADAWQYSIVETRDGKKYVRADRQVIFGNDPQSWSEQLEGYINGKIRRGEDVTLIGADGDELLLTATSAGKLSDNHTSDGRTMSDEAFERKANAAAHIDELAQVSERKGKVKKDRDGRHGSMASDGWSYRTAYFEDFDGKYYEVTISAAQGADGRIIYNIGQMKEEAHPKIKGSRASNGDGPRGFASSDHSVRNSGENVNRKFSVSEDGRTQDELLDFVTQFRSACAVNGTAPTTEIKRFIAEYCEQGWGFALRRPCKTKQPVRGRRDGRRSSRSEGARRG